MFRPAIRGKDEFMILNELGPDRGPIPELADRHTVSLIGAEADEAVPQGIPLAETRLPSLDTEEVATWLAEHDGLAVFVAAGTELASDGTPTLAVYVTEPEYLAVTSAMPR
jgi:hypothetical protein